MMTSSSHPHDTAAPLGHQNRWPRGARPLGGVLTLLGLVLAAGAYPLGRTIADAGGRDAIDAMAALITPPVSGTTIALRVLLLIALALTGAVALTRVALGAGAVPPAVVRLTRIAGLAGAAVCVAEALTGLAGRPVAALMVALLVGAVLLAPGRRPAAVAVLSLLGLALAVLLGVELGILRSGLPRAVDIAYALLGSLLLGASVFGVAVLPGRAAHPLAVAADEAESTAPAASLPDGSGGPERELVATRLAGIALVSGVLTTAAGVAQLGLTGPRTRFDLLHTTYGVGALAQALLPAVVTLSWLLARRPAGRVRGAELSRLATGFAVVAFLAAATLATLPRPAAGPQPGQPLLRPVDLGLRHLAVLVMPMRPGPNLVHVGDGGGGELVSSGHHHGAPAAPVTPPTALTVAAGGTPVTLGTRPGAPGLWAVVDLPAGGGTLTVSGDGLSVGVPIDAGHTPADPAVQRTLAGPDGPECASAALGALAAGHGAPATCPSQTRTPYDAGLLTRSVDYLVERGVPGIDLDSDGSARSRAAVGVVRAESARKGLAMSLTPTPGHTLVVLSGWDHGAAALTALSFRSVSTAFGGTLLAPWLMSGPVLGRNTTEIVPLDFDPQQSAARVYSLALAAAFPGETPSTSGYRGWRGTDHLGDLRFYGAAQVNVPMGGAMDDMDMGGQPGDWYPAGTIVGIGDAAPTGALTGTESPAPGPRPAP